MTRGQLLALAAVAAAAAYAMAAGGGLLRISAEADAASGQAGWEPSGMGPAHAHLAHPEDFQLAGTPMLGTRHPLFRRPAYPGVSRHRVSTTGWAWFADPPSEQGL